MSTPIDRQTKSSNKGHSHHGPSMSAPTISDRMSSPGRRLNRESNTEEYTHIRENKMSTPTDRQTKSSNKGHSHHGASSTEPKTNNRMSTTPVRRLKRESSTELDDQICPLCGYAEKYHWYEECDCECHYCSPSEESFTSYRMQDNRKKNSGCKRARMDQHHSQMVENKSNKSNFEKTQNGNGSKDGVSSADRGVYANVANAVKKAESGDGTGKEKHIN